MRPPSWLIFEVIVLAGLIGVGQWDWAAVIGAMMLLDVGVAFGRTLERRELVSERRRLESAKQTLRVVAEGLALMLEEVASRSTRPPTP